GVERRGPTGGGAGVGHAGGDAGPAAAQALALVAAAGFGGRAAQQRQGGSHAEDRRDAVGELGVPVVLGLAAAHTASLGTRLGQPPLCTPFQLTNPSTRWDSCRAPPSPWRHRTCNPDERTNLMTTTSLNAPE